MLPRLFYDNLFDEMEMKGMSSDVYLKDNTYHLEIDVPGFNKEDISIEVNKGNVIIKALKEEKEETDDKKYIRRERRYNKLERSFYFADIDEDNIKAEFNNGTLHLTIPQRQEEVKKQITID